MSIWDIKLFIKEGLNNLQQVLKSDDCSQDKVNEIIYNTIENIKASNDDYKNNAIKDFLIEAKRLVLFTDYNLDEVIKIEGI
jgi:hypothetical protein